MPSHPKFSLQQLLLAMIAFAAISACLASAYRGNAVSYGLCVALLLMLVPAAISMLVYWLGYGFACGWQWRKQRVQARRFGANTIHHFHEDEVIGSATKDRS